MISKHLLWLVRWFLEWCRCTKSSAFLFLVWSCITKLVWHHKIREFLSVTYLSTVNWRVPIYSIFLQHQTREFIFVTMSCSSQIIVHIFGMFLQQHIREFLSLAWSCNSNVERSYLQNGLKTANQRVSIFSIQSYNNNLESFYLCITNQRHCQDFLSLTLVSLVKSL